MQFAFFPSRQISWYMARLFLTRTLAVLALLVLVLQTLDLLGQSGDILAYPGNGDAQLWHYVGLRVPQIVARFLPFSVLLGTLVMLATLNQNSEIISMKAAGLSAHQILAPLVVSALGVAIISYAFNDRIVARSTAALSAWQAVDYGPIPRDSGVKSNPWVRDGNNLVNAAIVAGRGTQVQLRKVEIFNRINNSLTTIIQAPRGHYDAADKSWVLEEARQFDVARGTVTNVGTVRFGRDIRPDQFTLAKVDPDALTFSQLQAAISDLHDAGRPTAELEANLWHKLSGPLSALLMPILGSVAAFGLARSGQLFVRAVMGMALGFAYFVADNFSLAMGSLGAYPPFLAAWAPFLLFLLVGETVLFRTEE
ncbi:MAG: LPS export ABC transporter permease LptG [Sphingobium sp.]|uniref:LPS export ABC transporter permease LptG n=1 Tax=Sphingobium xenophagum TaxID=121428 RepID=A0A249MUB0_SPHXE|nr:MULTISPECIES: LPS export ABC transporter permease LptG [Sphingobium]MBU0659497.1 LPS export ABC transporter permease LptG [Alphaproteobacteria bacterium]ASY44739.1 LPS export ABC transporter permease LptG [Sphingobium xenophagum]MBA4753907.1 LPS export ABC transporter permease LptG [Sphingobium sp.]MBS88500.1 LPS export ABC transporter permease LptG [Sphingobium sp.]MBU0867887.1 LPS export ABC transporter permease LptG [Alphaproteobacteria bacterium]|tara:strand:+ start:6009 stop:7109 length:1101 start_codon:yes stop_codon:yes gene_type:complete